MYRAMASGKGRGLGNLIGVGTGYTVSTLYDSSSLTPVAMDPNVLAEKLNAQIEAATASPVKENTDKKKLLIGGAVALAVVGGVVVFAARKKK